MPAWTGCKRFNFFFFSERVEHICCRTIFTACVYMALIVRTDNEVRERGSQGEDLLEPVSSEILFRFIHLSTYTR